MSRRLGWFASGRTLLPLGPQGYAAVRPASSWGLVVPAELPLGGVRGQRDLPA